MSSLCYANQLVAWAGSQRSSSAVVDGVLYGTRPIERGLRIRPFRIAYEAEVTKLGA